MKVLLLTICIGCKAKYIIDPENLACNGLLFGNISCRQGDTRGVRHLFYTLKACGVRLLVDKTKNARRLLNERIFN